MLTPCEVTETMLIIKMSKYFICLFVGSPFWCDHFSLAVAAGVTEKRDYTVVPGSLICYGNWLQWSQRPCTVPCSLVLGSGIKSLWLIKLSKWQAVYKELDEFDFETRARGYSCILVDIALFLNTNSKFLLNDLSFIKCTQVLLDDRFNVYTVSLHVWFSH